ncbi:MAG: phospho-N-acetylmuramoyl-pentapeptide-transferase [Lachnospiraceae bacterium]|nr:phospho-N-acetylmuramoyl-pentapeptide-transferase [Lachnospiraceae bacterium]
MLYYLFPNIALYFNPMYAGLAAFIITALMIRVLKKSLPADQGREFAVNGALSKGKARGGGIIFICVYIILALMFVPLIPNARWETLIYLVLTFAACLEGFLDDASKVPWGELKKGLIDLIICAGTAFTFYIYNGSVVRLALFNVSFELPAVVFIILATLLLWASINVVNCTDGVDGLCGSLTLISTAGFIFILMGKDSASVPSIIKCIIMIGVISAYLLFNCSPSTVLMGDAGSRAIGLFLGLTALETGSPLAFIPICLIFIIDGGLGLIKVALLRTVKLKILKNTRTPIHDHVRKNKGWSDTQTVTRFVIAGAFVVVLYLCFI